MTVHFGEMLMNRRRQMGVSIQQVANTIKMRPQIIEYFETENFSAMPPRGYAQGMIASYARFLGLNPREVVDMYFDCLDAYERTGSGGRVGRYQDPAADASPRSSNAQGRYLMVNGAPAASKFVARPPQAGYVSEAHSAHEPISASRLRPADSARPRDRRASGYRDDLHEYRDPRRTSRASGGRPAPTRRGADPRRASYDPYDDPRSSRPRNVAAGQQPRGRGGYPAAARGGAPTPSRRDPRYGQGARPRGGSVPPRRGGQARGGSSLPPLDPRTMLLVGVVALLLVVFAVMSIMKGCAPKEQASPQGSQQTPAVQKVDGADDAASDADADADADAGDADASKSEGESGDEDASASKDEAGKQPKETKVKIVLKEKGTVAWIEVKLDGKSVFAKQEVGPFELEYDVKQQIDITTNMPSEVVVYHNGEKVRYDTKVSGVAKVSIVAPKDEDSEKTEGAQDGEGSEDGSDTGASDTQ